jgi:hypothetical protein
MHLRVGGEPVAGAGDSGRPGGVYRGEAAMGKGLFGVAEQAHRGGAGLRL